MSPPPERKPLPLKVIGIVVLVVIVCLGLAFVIFGGVSPFAQKSVPPSPNLTPSLYGICNITPSGGAFRTTVAVTIDGTNFSYGASPDIWLAKPGEREIPAADVMVVSPDRITCVFPLYGSPVSAGQWNVLLRKPGEQDAVQIGVFTVTTNASPSVTWNWSADGWGDWQHSVQCTGLGTSGPGSCLEYGPSLENGAGIYGSTVSYDRVATESRVSKTFNASSGSGWNTVTFRGQLSPSTTDTMFRWMAIRVNGVTVFYANATMMPPGNDGQPFTITQSFAPSTRATIEISSGQDPTWEIAQYTMQFDSLTLS